jgi:hypothetical protein
LRHIVLRDLIEWRVPRDSLIAANAWPASPTRALLGGTEGGAQQDDPNDYANVCAYAHCDFSFVLPKRDAMARSLQSGGDTSYHMGGPDCMPNPLVQQRLEMAVMFQFSADLTITPLADRS